MNEHLTVNGSRNEQQHIKSTDSKTDNTGKYILRHFCVIFLITSSECFVLIMIHSPELDAFATACDALANEGLRNTLVQNGWRQLQQFGKKSVRKC